MITPSLLQQFATSLEGKVLDDVLFDLYDQFADIRFPNRRRDFTWKQLENPEVQEQFLKYVKAHLEPQTNEATLRWKHQTRERLFRTGLDQLAALWQQALMESNRQDDEEEC